MRSIAFLGGKAVSEVLYSIPSSVNFVFFAVIAQQQLGWFFLLARSPPMVALQGGASPAASGKRQRTKTRGKSSWLPGAGGCHVFLPLTLLCSAHSVQRVPHLLRL